MKIFLFASLSLISSFSFSTEVANSDFSRIGLSHHDIYQSIPTLRNIWSEKQRWNGVDIFKQSNAFDIDGVQYRDIRFGEMPIKMDGFGIYDTPNALQNKGFISNKIRLMAGLSPISNEDNLIIMLCKLENHIDGQYYEMTVTQYNTIRKAFPSNYDMGHLCVSGQVLGQYWKARLGDYYDQFGNKK